MADFLHTMVRITDPEKARSFYEALGFRFSNDMDIVREGELETTNYFFSIGEHENVLELTFNHDGRSYELGTAYGHVAIGVDDLDGTLTTLKDEHGIEPERPPYQVREGGSRICFVRDPGSSPFRAPHAGSPLCRPSWDPKGSAGAESSVSVESREFSD